MNLRRSVVVSVAVAAICIVAGPAGAEKPNPAFAGRIMLSDKRFPASASSIGAYNAKVRSISKTNFYEDKDKKSWKVYFAGFLKAPLNDVEYIVKIFELTGRGQQLLVSFEQFTDERGHAVLLSNMTLERKMIGVNKELLVTLENKGRVLATGRLKILGQGDKFSGKVDFSEEEAQGGAKEEE